MKPIEKNPAVIERTMMHIKKHICLLLRKKNGILLWGAAVLLIAARNLSAAGYVGLHGGVSLPLSEFRKTYPTSWAAGIDFEIETDMKFLSLHAKNDYYAFTGGPLDVFFIPLYAAAALKTPWDFPLKLYAFGGGGIVWEFAVVKESGKNLFNYDPLIVGGGGLEWLFTLKKVTFGPYVQAAYHFIFQKSQVEAEYNGELVVIMLGVKLKVF